MTRTLRLWKAWGLPGLVGVMALVAAAGLLAAAHRWDAEAATLHAEAQQLRARARPATALAAAPQDAKQWQAALPGPTDRQQRLADLLELAQRLDLGTPRTEHRLSSADGLERLRVTLPVTGSYAQLRRFIAAALAHDAALSLDAVKLRRASPLATEVEAELQWSLHGRALP